MALTWWRLIAEALLDNGGGDLFDYKFFCFNGDLRLIQFDAERFARHRRELFTPDWRRINACRLIYPPVGRDVPRPDNLAEMLDCARRLSSALSSSASTSIRTVDGRSSAK